MNGPRMILAYLQGLRAICRGQDGKPCLLEDRGTEMDDGRVIVDGYDGLFRRWANERDLMRYIAMVEQDDSPVVTRTELTQEDRQAEAVFLGLRMMQGLSMNDYQQRFGADLRKKHESDLMRFREAGLIAYAGDQLKLTRAGALLSNEVFSAFV